MLAAFHRCQLITTLFPKELEPPPPTQSSLIDSHHIKITSSSNSWARNQNPTKDKSNYIHTADRSRLSASALKAPLHTKSSHHPPRVIPQSPADPERETTFNMPFESALYISEPRDIHTHTAPSPLFAFASRATESSRVSDAYVNQQYGAECSPHRYYTPPSHGLETQNSRAP